MQHWDKKNPDSSELISSEAAQNFWIEGDFVLVNWLYSTLVSEVLIWYIKLSRKLRMTTPKAKPYKLKPSDGVMTRDDVSLWEYTLLASCRQIADWQQFLPGGENSTWIATDDDVNNGLTHATAATQTKLRNDFANFLTCVATHCPTGFMDTVMRESVSFKNIVEQIRTTYSLDSKGEKFLSIMDIKLEFSPSFTYEQGWMLVKDFCMASLLSVGSIYKTKTLTEAETISPLAENFMMKEFLLKVHPKLPEHIKNTKGHLFTRERPTLACNKAIIFDLIDTMLAEIEAIDMTVGSLSVNQLGQPRQLYRGGRRTTPRFPFRGQNVTRGGPPRGFPRGMRPPFPVRQQTQGRKEDCSYCVEARMFDSSKGHVYRECPFRLGLASPYQQTPYQPRPINNNNGMKILLVQDGQHQQTPPLQHLPMSEGSTMQAWYDQNYQHEYAVEPHTDQQYYEGYGYAAAGYEDGSYDHAYQPPHDTQL